MTAGYDRHGYDRGKRKALNTWGRKLEEILTDSAGKVVEIVRDAG